MERISQISARTIEVPLEHPVFLGGNSVRTREYCFVELVSNTGLTGQAIAFTRGGDLTTIIIQTLAPLIQGVDPGQIEGIWQKIYEQTRAIGRQGLLMRAISLIDIALWDMKGKQAGIPLYRLLGGFKESVMISMAGGYYSEDKGIKELIEEYEAYLACGYKYLKLMVGGATMQEDLVRYTELRKTLPSNITLGIDANGSWNESKAVLRWIEQAEYLTGVPLSYVEEPLAPEQMQETAWLRERTHAPIAAGEFLAGRWTFRDWMREGAIDIVRADATMCGGISEWKKIASIALANNLKLFPHYFASLHIHLALALPGCDWIEEVSTAGYNSNVHLIIGKSYTFKDGVAYPNNNPGLGMQIDQAFMKAHTTRELLLLE